MTREQARKNLDVIKAYADGEEIEILLSGGWSDIPQPNFNFALFEYRVKPKPRKLWTVENSYGIIVPFSSYESALIWKEERGNKNEIIEFIEITKE